MNVSQGTHNCDWGIASTRSHEKLLLSLHINFYLAPLGPSKNCVYSDTQQIHIFTMFVKFCSFLYPHLIVGLSLLHNTLMLCTKLLLLLYLSYSLLYYDLPLHRQIKNHQWDKLVINQLISISYLPVRGRIKETDREILQLSTSW